MKLSRAIILLGLAPFVFMGAECNVDGPADPPTKPNQMTVSISTDGYFDGTLSKVVKNGNKYVLMAQEGPSGSRRVIDMEIPVRTAVPYTVSVPSDPTGIINYCIESSPGFCSDFRAHNANKSSSGSITVTEVTATTLKGTFSGRLLRIPQTGADTVRTMTSGSFYGTF
jgi:hypothetical protein